MANICIEVWTLSVEDEKGTHTSVHGSEADALAHLFRTWDPKDHYSKDVQSLIDQLGIVIYIAPHQLSVSVTATRYTKKEDNDY